MTDRGPQNPEKSQRFDHIKVGSKSNKTAKFGVIDIKTPHNFTTEYENSVNINFILFWSQFFFFLVSKYDNHLD